MNISELIYKIKEFLQEFSWKISLNIILVGFISGYTTNLLITYYLFPSSEDYHKLKKTSQKKHSAKNTKALAKKDKKVILKRNLFNKEGTYPDYNTSEKKSNKDTTTKSQLPIKLLGTIFGGDPKLGLAVIQSGNNKEILSVFVGEFLQDEVKLIEIHKEKIIILNKDAREYIEIPPYKIVRSSRVRKKQSRGVFALGPSNNVFREEGFERIGNDITLSKDYKKRILTTDFRKVLGDAKAVPYIENGELNGFKLTRIKSGSIYEKSGLQNNDIIKEINGVPLIDTAQAIKLLNSLRNETQIDIAITRGGSNLTFNLQVK